MSGERPELEITRETTVTAQIAIPPSILMRAALEWCAAQGIELPFPAGDWRLFATSDMAELTYRKFEFQSVIRDAGTAAIPDAPQSGPGD